MSTPLPIGTPLVASAALALLCLAGCIATVPHGEPEVLAAARPMFPDYTPDELEVDRDIFVDNCTGCHVLTPGKRLPVDEWPTIIEEMEEEVLYDAPTGARILRYLQTSRLFWEVETERLRAEREARRGGGEARRGGGEARRGGGEVEK